MKKKIKDLTIGQIVEIVKNNKCNGCPLYNSSFPCYVYYDLPNDKKRAFERSLEEEIEVKDEKEK